MAIGKPIRADGHFALLSDHFALLSGHFALLSDHFALLSGHFALLSDHFALLSDQGDRNALENRPPQVSCKHFVVPSTMSPHAHLARSPVGLEDLAMHSCPGKMKGLEYQLAILTDVVETPSDASDHGSFPVASASPKLPLRGQNFLPDLFTDY